MEGTLLVALCVAAGCLYGWLEFRHHRRNLRRIPIRVHVNGTRGKSGVTRLIAAGLRAGGLRTFAKTTGTLARAIFPDGEEYPIFRPGRTNVIEQKRMVRIAAQEQVDALVIECMALHPSLQALCELKFIQATHGVITNARADHLDVMGPTAEDVAMALSSTTPVQAKLFTAERVRLAPLQWAAADRGTELITIGADDVADVSQAELNQFNYVEHAENVALALRVCSDLGVDRQVALRGMWAADPDPGVMKVFHVRKHRHRVAFVNGFAANDPESTRCIWHMMLERLPHHQTRMAIINCRSDRTHRSVQLAETMGDWQQADHLILIGTGTQTFHRVATESGIDPLSMLALEEADVSEIVEAIMERAGESAVIMGMGNTQGPGLALCDYFETLSSDERTHAPAAFETWQQQEAA